MSSLIRARLIADGTVSGLVGTRVYLEELEQGCSMPAVVMTMDDDEPQNTLGGELSLTNESWTIECWGSTYSSAKSLAAAVTTAMAATGTDFKSVRTGKSITYEGPTGLRGVSLEYSLWY